MTLCTPTDRHKKSLTKTLRKLKLKINENKKQIKQITKTKRKKSKTQNSKDAIPISLRERVLRPSLPSAAVTAVLRVFFDPVQIITHPRVHSGITSARASLAPGDDRDDIHFAVSALPHESSPAVAVTRVRPAGDVSGAHHVVRDLVGLVPEGAAGGVREDGDQDLLQRVCGVALLGHATPARDDAQFAHVVAVGLRQTGGP